MLDKKLFETQGLFDFNHLSEQQLTSYKILFNNTCKYIND